MGEQMKTLVEIYDTEPIYNVLASIAFQPMQTVFLCPTRTVTAHEKEEVLRFWRFRRLQGNACFVELDLRDTESMKKKLKDIIDYAGDAAVDITGGSDAVLFLLGGMFDKNVPVFAFDFARGCFSNIRNADMLEGVRVCVQLSVQDLLALSGASRMQAGHIQQDEMTEEDFCDASAVWQVYCAHEQSWQKNVRYLQQITSRYGVDPERDLSVHAPICMAMGNGECVFANKAILIMLAARGVLQNLSFAGDSVRFQYKNQTLYRLLQNTGCWLELFVFTAMKQSGWFDDVQINVVIDWNSMPNETVNLCNEVDIIATKGMRSLFISCKTGTVTPQALHELAFMRKRFGGKLAKGVVVTMDSPRTTAPTVFQRAMEMGLGIIDRNAVRQGNLVDALKNALCPPLSGDMDPAIDLPTANSI